MRKKTFVVSDESVNTQGFRVLNAGVEFAKHVPALFEHEGEIYPIGHWTGMTLKDGKWLADMNYNDSTAKTKEICDMVEAGHYGQASIGIDLRSSTFSPDPNLVLKGQTGQTCTKAFVPEISIVTFASNRNAIALYDGGITNRVNLADGKDSGVPKLDLNNDDKKVSMINILKKLNLSDTATEVEAVSEIDRLRSELAENVRKLKEFTDAEEARKQGEVVLLLDAAVKENKIGEAEKPSFLKLFSLDFNSAKSILEARNPMVKLSDIPKTDVGGSNALKYNGKTWKELQKENPEQLKKLKTENLNLFKLMYKADFNKEWVD